MKNVMLDNNEFVSESGQSILDAALAQGIDFPFNCQLGSCGRCKCKLVKGEIRPLGPFDYALDADEISADLILACQSSAKTDIEISLTAL